MSKITSSEFTLLTLSYVSEPVVFLVSSERSPPLCLRLLHLNFKRTFYTVPSREVRLPSSTFPYLTPNPLVSLYLLYLSLFLYPLSLFLSLSSTLMCTKTNHPHNDQRYFPSPFRCLPHTGVTYFVDEESVRRE